MRESPVTHPVVTTDSAHGTGEPTSALLLPGNIEPLYSAAVYARTEGYMERTKCGYRLEGEGRPGAGRDLVARGGSAAAAGPRDAGAVGSSVAAGEGRALEQAKANAELARLTKERDLPLGQQHAISQQIVDEAVQAYDARVADVAAADGEHHGGRSERDG